MNNKGYSLIELLVLVIGLGIVATILIVKTSYAFDDNSADMYKQEILTINNAARIYAESNADIFNDKDSVTIKVNELVKNDLLSGDDKEGNVIDPRTKNVYLNEKSIKITKDKDGKIKTEFLEDK